MTAIYDGALVAEDAPLFSPMSRAVRYGDGVFETLRSYDGQPFATGEHLERLARSMEWARMHWPAPRETLSAEIANASRTIEGDAAVRVFVLRGEGPSLNEAPTHRLITAEALALGRDLRSGRAIIASGAPAPSSEGIKYTRYLPHLLAQGEAHARGAEEALMCDSEGRVVEGATSNVFALIGGDLVTPGEASGILLGITRAHVLRLAAAAGLHVVLRPIEPREVERASELFVTSSLRELYALIRVGEKTIGAGTIGPVTRRLHALYRELTLLR